MDRSESSTPAAGPVRRLLRVMRRVLYWSLPPLILYLVFRRIDLERLGQLASSANFVMILVGNVLIAVVVALAALRWHFLLRRYECALLPIATSIAEYWKSLAVGVAVPGSLGSDAYRMMVLGRLKGQYLRNAFVIGVEKLAALFSCAVLIAGLYPLLAPNRLPSVFAQLIDALYVIFVTAVVIVISAMLVRRLGLGRRLAKALNARIDAMARRVSSLASNQPAQEESSPGAGLGLMLSVFSPAVVLPTVALSMAILFISTVQAQLYFQALAYDIPFHVNLFVTPLLFILFTLPISFGGIGIREGAFILLYAPFGVPAETALAVSFCGLLSILLSYAIGAACFLLSKRHPSSEGARTE